jgi:hypothetical protein
MARPTSVRLVSAICTLVVFNGCGGRSDEEMAHATRAKSHDNGSETATEAGQPSQPLGSESLDDQAKRTNEASKPSQLADGWLVENVSATVLHDEFKEQVGESYVTVSPGDDSQIITLEFSMTAMSPDPAAKEKCINRATFKNMAFFEKEVNGLEGDFRFFDLPDLGLVSEQGMRYSPIWNARPIHPRSAWGAPATTMLSKGLGVFGPGLKHWHCERRTEFGEFYGLVDVGVPVDMMCVFRIPKVEAVNSLQWKIGQSEGVPLVID